MTTSLKDLLESIKQNIGNRKAYLYGGAVRDILLETTPSQYSVFVKVHHTEHRDKILNTLPVHTKVFYTLGTKFTTTDVFTLNLMYVDLDDVMNGNFEIKSLQNAQKDFDKKSIKFTKEALENFKPEYILKAIMLSVDTGFHLDPKTITEIFNRKDRINEIEKRNVYKFLHEALKTKKTRRIISYLNALGISMELFGFNLYETSILNHMQSSDTLEFFSILFNNVKAEDLPSILVDKCGFFQRDVAHVVSLARALDGIENENDISARKFLKTIKNKRVSNALRLLRNLNFKELVKNIKKQKEAAVSLDDLCVDAAMVKLAFGIEDEDILHKLLDSALEKVVKEPDFNEQVKILNYLNKERKNFAN